MLKFIQENPVMVTVSVIILIGIVVLLYKYRKDVLGKAALVAVAKAQEAWGSDLGKIKFAEAYTYIKKNYPVITFFISEKGLSDLIEKALKELKETVKAKASQADKNGIELDSMSLSLINQMSR